MSSGSKFADVKALLGADYSLKSLANNMIFIENIYDAVNGKLHGGALHEIFAFQQSDIAAATGLALGLTWRAGHHKPIVIVRQDVLDSEMGHLDGAGLLDFGIDLSRIILVKACNIENVLRAGEQSARCQALGAVLIQSWGNPKALDLKSTRRLALASAKSGVPVFMLRAGASQEPSAAITRWMIEAVPSRPLPANAPGAPAFILKLVRHRGGVEGRTWLMEWNSERACFEERKRFGLAALPRSVVSVSHHRPHLPQPEETMHRAG